MAYQVEYLMMLKEEKITDKCLFCHRQSVALFSEHDITPK